MTYKEMYKEITRQMYGNKIDKLEVKQIVTKTGKFSEELSGIVIIITFDQTGG